MFKPDFEFPEDCLELVHGGNSFTFPGWVEKWDGVPVFRCSGVTDVVQRAGLNERTYIQHLRVISESVDERVPAEWRAFFQTQTAWRTLGEPQIKKIQTSGLQPFDRVLMSVIYVAEFVERVLHKPVPRDYLQLIRIVPIPYHLDVDEDLWSQHVKDKKLRDKLLAALGHQDDLALKSALRDGKRVSWRTAEIITTELRKAKLKVEIVCSPGRKPEAVANEPLFLSRDVPHPPVTKFIRENRG